MADQLTPVLAYRCLVKEDDREAPSFLFESVTNGTQQVRVGVGQGGVGWFARCCGRGGVGSGFVGCCVWLLQRRNARRDAWFDRALLRPVDRPPRTRLPAGAVQLCGRHTRA
jgi:hypothetical protein